MFIYTLALSTFKNQAITEHVFLGEIEALGLTSATISAVSTREHDTGTDVDIAFDVEPSADDKAAVDAAAAAHEGEDNGVLLLDLVPESEQGRDVRAIDYKTGLSSRLHKVVTTMYRGEVREVDYYTDETETDLVLSVKVYADEALTVLGYSRNSLGQPLERWTKRTWYRKDGSEGVTKTTHKVYTHDAAAQMREGIRRRTNVIDKLSVDVLRAYVFTTAVDPLNPTDAEMSAAYDVVTEYMDKYEAGVTTFIRVGRNAFLTPPESPNVTDDTETWLDNNIEAMGYPTGWTIRTIILEDVKNISD